MTIVSFTIPGEAVAFARAGARGKQRFTPAKQRNAMATVKLYGDQAMRASGLSPLDGPVRMVITATYPVPQSWSKKRREQAGFKTSKPDIGNIQKLVEDALNGVAYIDDAQIAETNARKVYGSVASLFVLIEPLSQVAA